MTCLECQQLLSPYEKGELAPDEAGRVAEHLSGCRICEGRTAVLRELDDWLRAAATPEPSASLLVSVRRRVHRDLGGGEIMDVDQVAAFLRLSQAQVLDSLDELPCFEVAGQIRFRRAALLKWIEERESLHRREHLRVHLEWGQDINFGDALTLEP